MKKILIALLLTIFTASGAQAIGTEKFKEEVEKEAIAIKLTREVSKGGYKVITTDELQGLLQAGEKCRSH